MGKSPTEARLNPKIESEFITVLFITSFQKSNGAFGIKKQFKRMTKDEFKKLS